MEELNQYDAEALELMAGLLGKGFMIFPIDPELKRSYYNTAVKCNKNPHDMLREDMGKRVKVMEARRLKADEQAAKDAAKTLLSRKAEEVKKEREKELQRKKEK